MEKNEKENPHKSHKRLIQLLIILSILYFALLVFPNATGVKTPEMVAVFEIDEYAQYPHALQLLNSGNTLKQSIRNFLVYDHYFYGYPFYFFSGLSLVPFKWIAGSDWHTQTQTIMVILRQLVNVLPNILTVWLLTYCATQFKQVWKTILIFVVLLFYPGLLSNSLWWHPDGIGLLFVALSLFFLRIDRLRFGLFYYLTAVSVGIAFGVKYMGAFFILLIPVYLLIGTLEKKIRWKKMIFLAAVFVSIMLVVIVLSNPLLLLQERSAIIENQALQFSQTSKGILMGKQPFLQNGKLPTWFTQNYGSVPFLLLLLAGMITGIVKKAHRIQSMLLAAWVLPYTLVILNASSQRAHYWLPIFLPLVTALLPLLPDIPVRQMRWQKKAGLAALAILVAVQLSLFMNTDIKMVTQALQREANSPSLQFYDTVHTQWITTPGQGKTNVIYRDWHMYHPSDKSSQVFIDWDLADYAMLKERQPDYLLLEKANVITYGAENYLDSAPDPDRLQAMHLFYRDALLDQIEGYSVLYQDSYGMLFSKNSD